MKRSLITLVASAATLAAVSAASAGEVVTLSDAELDSVTAAGSFVSAELTGDALVFGAFLMDNIPGTRSFTSLIAMIVPFSGVPKLTLTATADTSD